jgi:hypothetical protein
MKDSGLLQLISEKCGIGSWSHINSPNIALAFLDLLDPRELTEVDIMMDWVEFEDYEREVLQQGLADWYYSLAAKIVPDVSMLSQAYEIAALSQSEYIELMRDASLPNEVIIEYVTEALASSDDDDRGELMEQFLIALIHSVWVGPISSVTDSNGNVPCEENDYLMSLDGKSFAGIFHSDSASYPFRIVEKADGTWGITY